MFSTIKLARNLSYFLIQVFAENYPAVFTNLTTTKFMSKFANRTFSFTERNYTTDSTGSKINPVTVLRLDVKTESMQVHSWSKVWERLRHLHLLFICSKQWFLMSNQKIFDMFGTTCGTGLIETVRHLINLRVGSPMINARPPTSVMFSWSLESINLSVFFLRALLNVIRLYWAGKGIVVGLAITFALLFFLAAGITLYL